MTAAEHAQRASELLDRVEQAVNLEAERAADPMKVVEDATSGRGAFMARSVDYSLTLARAHAEVAAAVALTSGQIHVWNHPR